MEQTPDSPDEINAEAKGSGLAGDLIPQPAQKEVILLKPSRELSVKLLSELNFQESIVGYKMHSMAGSTQNYLYSFEDVVNFLHFDAGDLNIRGSGSIGYIDLNKLQEWVAGVFGDKELAEAIGEKIKEGSSYKESVELIKPLMEQRLKQCEEIAREETEA